MGQQQRIKRFVGKQSAVDSGRYVFDLPRDFDMESIIVRVTGNTVLTVAGTAVRAEAQRSCMRRLPWVGPSDPPALECSDAFVAPRSL